MTEADLTMANALVAQFYRNTAPKPSYERKFDIQRQLLTFGVMLDKPVPTPDPRAPAGGSQIALVA